MAYVRSFVRSGGGVGQIATDQVSRLFTTRTFNLNGCTGNSSRAPAFFPSLQRRGQVSSRMARPQITFYHNPTCSKSRECASTLIPKFPNLNIETVEYTTSPPSVDDLRLIVSFLPEEARGDIVRTNDLSPEEKNAVQSGSVDRVVEVLQKDLAKRLQRPLVVDWKAKKAAIGRPMDRVEELLETASTL